MARRFVSVGAAVTENGACLATQRGSRMSFSRKWEFPGGKVEPGESPREALVREIREELGIDIEVGEFLGRGYGFSGPGRVVLDVYAARRTGGKLKLREHAECGWFDAGELESLDWVEPAEDVLRNVKCHLQRSGPRNERALPEAAAPNESLVDFVILPSTLCLLYTETWFWLMSNEFEYLWDLALPYTAWAKRFFQQMGAIAAPVTSSR